jgi:hypothetical protein
MRSLWRSVKYFDLGAARTLCSQHVQALKLILAI